jgi:hypothetical protein
MAYKSNILALFIYSKCSWYIERKKLRERYVRCCDRWEGKGVDRVAYNISLSEDVNKTVGAGTGG